MKRGLKRLFSLAKLRAYLTGRRGNVSMIYALAIIPVLGAVGLGIDTTRGVYVQQRLAAMVDAAALAVGAQPGLTQAQAQVVAQNYFNANNSLDPSFGVPAQLTVTISGQSVRVATSDMMPTTIANLIGVTQVPLQVSSNVVWGQTKLWVSLVLDNTGSMTQTDSTGLSKMAALQTATNQLLTLLQGAALNPGDVQVALIPFSKTVNVGTTNVNAAWIDWTDWESSPANATTVVTGNAWSDYGPSAQGGTSSCPWTSSRNGYTCQPNATNGSSGFGSIPTSITINGVTVPGPICPGVDSGSKNSGRMGRYYNGCFDSVPTTSTSSTTNVTNSSTQPCINSSSCTTATYCTGYPLTTTNSNTSGNTTTVTTTVTTCACVTTTGSKKTCTRASAATAVATTTTTGKPFTHTWRPSAHSTWNGCIMDRNQNFDAQNTAPDVLVGSLFPAENAQSCVPSVMNGTLNYSWTNLHSAVNVMSAGGSTNQAIGLQWGWMAQTHFAPLNAPSLPDNTAQYIIIVSDGLNTQNRWGGDGSNQYAGADARMAQACTNAKAAGFIIYSVFVDLAGTQGNSTVLQNCASDASKYFDLTTSGQVITTLNTIGQQITNLHVSQ